MNEMDVRTPRFLTRNAVVEYVRNVYGIPLTKNRLNQLCAKGRGPKVTSFYGNRELIAPDDVDVWVMSALVNDTSTYPGRAGPGRGHKRCSA